MNKKLNKLNDRPELATSEIVKDMPRICSDETAAVEFFEAQRWGDSPRCPHCDGKDVYQIKDRDGSRNKRFLWRCRKCGEQYTVRIGSIYEESRLPLRYWAYAFWRACSSKKGVSALEIKRQCQISYKSALFLMHRIRFAMKENDTPETPKLGGENVAPVEIDETYIGGKPSPLLRQRRIKATGFRKDSNKTPVVAMVERGSIVRTKVVPRVNHKNLKSFLEENISKGAVVNTDQHFVYPLLVHPIVKHRGGKHYVVNHSQREYARITPDGTVAHVNNCESFFSLLKRGLTGTFHCVSKEHLHRYCDEFAFRWNTRRLNDGERLVAAVKNADGKRLLYSDAIGG
jgi:transposase-like protein